MMVIASNSSQEEMEYNSTSPEADPSPPLKEAAIPVPAATLSSAKSAVPLTPVWEHIVRSKNLPESVDLDGLFKVIHQRVRNPEWSVRQHALRVLKDVIPLLGGGDSLDERMNSILADIVANLGHLGPGVRKAAVDCLKTYLHHSQRTDRILRDLVQKGVKNATEFKVQPNMVLGIVLALPFLLRGNKKVSQNTIEFAIHSLLDKLVQVTHQDTVMRALLRIKESIGAKEFNNHLEMYWQPTIKKDFEALCDVYNLSSFIVDHDDNNEGNVGSEIRGEENEYTPLSDPEIHLGDVKKNFYYMKNESGAKERAMFKDNLGPPDKVILETEIKLNSGSAITMKIHEEGMEEEDNEAKNEGGENDDQKSINGKTFRVIRDLDFNEEDYEAAARRTPRKVRFGGEIVKMRTPDSDSNNPSDADVDSPRPRGGGEKGGGSANKSVIPVSLGERQRRDSFLSLDTQSAPASPSRAPTSFASPKKKVLSNSLTNLSKREDEVFGGKVERVVSRIPKRTARDVKSSRGRRKSADKSFTIKQNKKSDLKELDREKNQSQIVQKTSSTTRNEKKLELNLKTSDSGGRIVSDRSRDQFSPIPIHNEIEVIHNLTRSPERPNTTKAPIFLPQPEKPSVQTQTSLQTQEEENTQRNEPAFTMCTSNLNLSHHQENAADNERRRNEKTKKTREEISKQQQQQMNKDKEDGRFEYPEPAIPTRNGGVCLTCSSSSSGSESNQENNAEKIESLGIIDRSLLRDLQNKDDVWKRHFALQELTQDMKFNPAIVESLELTSTTFLQLMFGQMDHQTNLLLPLAEQAIILFINKTSMKTLTSDRVQTVLLLGLSRLGSPIGVRISLILAQRLPPGKIVEKLISHQVLGAKSSRVREGSLQILMAVCRLFPSTEVDVLTTVTKIVPALVGDKKSKVRRAALESLAALAQLASPSLVLDVAANAAAKREDGEMLLGVVRSRLSRRQLPAVDVRNGTVRYSTPSVIEEDWVSMGSTSAENSQFTKIQENALFKQNQSKVPMSAMSSRRASMVSNEIPSILERPRRSSATPMNYWRANSHKNRMFSGSECTPVINKDHHLPVWAIDNKNFAVNSNDVFANNNGGGFRPLYLVQPQNPVTKVSKRDATTTFERAYVDPEPPPEDKRLTSGLPKILRSTRGRSFSPPKSVKPFRPKPEGYDSEEEFSDRTMFDDGLLNGDQHRQYDGGGNKRIKNKNNNKQNTDKRTKRNMRKSFSTDHLYNTGLQQQQQQQQQFQQQQQYPNSNFNQSFADNKRMVNIYGHPLSSSSSTNSGASRERSESSNWYRHGKSRNAYDVYSAASSAPFSMNMPPINNNISSGNNKFKMRTTLSSGDGRSIGPVAAVTPLTAMSDNIYNERNHLKSLKSASSQKTRKFIVQEYNEFGADQTDANAVTRQPFSSGSDSSGYFTPPAEPQIIPERPAQTAISDRPPQIETIATKSSSYEEEEEEDLTIKEIPPPADIRTQQQQQISSLTTSNNDTEQSTTDLLTNCTSNNKSSSSENSNNRSPRSSEIYEASVSNNDENEIEENNNLNENNIVESSFVKINEGEDVVLAKSAVENSDDDQDSSDDEYEPEEKTYNVQESKKTPEIRRMSFMDDLNSHFPRKIDENRELSKSFGDIKSPTADFETARKLVSSAPSFKDTLDVVNGKGLLEVSPIKFARTPLPGTVVFDDDEFDQDSLDESNLNHNHNFKIIEEPSVPQKLKPSLLPQPIYKRKLLKTMSKSAVVPSEHVHQQNQNPQTNQRQPREHVTDILLKLSSPEWEKVVQGLEAVGRLFKQNTEITDMHLHQLATSVGRHIRNLRSQVARAACLAASEAFKHPKRTLENELEEFALPLLHRTADTNRFLRGDANMALDEMVACNALQPPKLVHLLTTKGGGHQNAVVRCSAARLLCNLCQKLGASRVFQLPKTTRDHIMLFGANMLTEGSLETRKHAKIMLGYLAQHVHFQKAIEDAVPATTRRHISKTLDSLK